MITDQAISKQVTDFEVRIRALGGPTAIQLATSLNALNTNTTAYNNNQVKAERTTAATTLSPFNGVTVRTIVFDIGAYANNL